MNNRAYHDSSIPADQAAAMLTAALREGRRPRDPRYYVTYKRPDIDPGWSGHPRWADVVVEVTPEALPALLDHIARQGWLLEAVR